MANNGDEVFDLPSASALQDQLAALATTAEQAEAAKVRAHKVYEHVLEQLLSKTWEQLEVIESEGNLMFTESLYRRSVQGGFVEEKVMVRVPREPDLRKARVQAREWAKAEKLDLDRDADLVEQMETLCVMSLVIHNHKPAIDPRTQQQFREQWEPDPKALEKRYDRGSLEQLWAKIDALAHVVDPRPNTMGEEETLAMISAIARARTVAPLHVYGPGAQESCIVFMASALLSSLGSKS